MKMINLVCICKPYLIYLKHGIEMCINVVITDLLEFSY